MQQTAPESTEKARVEAPVAEWVRPQLSVIRLSQTAKLGSAQSDGDGDYQTVGLFGVGEE